MKQFQRFLMVGALGFIVDFSVLYIAVNAAGLGTFAGRLVSFIVAASVTWKANRHFTFAGNGAARTDARAAAGEWLRYVSTTAIGGAINIGVYQLWLGMTDHRSVNLFLAVVAGSAVALIFNFLLSKYVVFRALNN
jgi:putative flippase GtrA